MSRRMPIVVRTWDTTWKFAWSDEGSLLMRACVYSVLFYSYRQNLPSIHMLLHRMLTDPSPSGAPGQIALLHRRRWDSWSCWMDVRNWSFTCMMRSVLRTP